MTNDKIEEVKRKLKIKQWLKEQINYDIKNKIPPIYSMFKEGVIYNKQEKDYIELWEAWLDIKCREAISLTKTEYEKEINKNNGEWNKIVSEKQKEINDLKFKLQRTAKVWYDKGFNDNQIKTSKKVEELIDKIDKELRHNVIEFELNDVPCCVKDVKVMHDFLINLKDELFSPQNHIPQREEFSAVKKNGCSNNSYSPEEDFAKELNSEQEEKD